MKKIQPERMFAWREDPEAVGEIFYCYFNGTCVGIIRDWSRFYPKPGKPWQAHGENERLDENSYHATAAEAKAALIRRLTSKGERTIRGRRNQRRNMSKRKTTEQPVPKRWETRIAEARKRGYFLKEDEKKARNWVTCTCGEQDPRIERENGVPIDAILFELGSAFGHYVDHDQFYLAEMVLHRIERRAAILIRRFTLTCSALTERTGEHLHGVLPPLYPRGVGSCYLGRSKMNKSENTPPATDTPEVPEPSQQEVDWRFLDPDDTVWPNDEHLTARNQWVQTPVSGGRAGVGRYRRRITPPPTVEGSEVKAEEPAKPNTLEATLRQWKIAFQQVTDAESDPNASEQYRHGCQIILRGRSKQLAAMISEPEENQ